MNSSTRVLARRGARELTFEEVERVSGGLPTDTACTWGPKGRDGDVALGEC